MKTTVDADGTLEIPHGLCLAAGLQPGADVEIQSIDGRIEVTRVPVDYRVERHGRFTVLVPDRDVPALTLEEANALVAAARGEPAPAVDGSPSR